MSNLCYRGASATLAAAAVWSSASPTEAHEIRDQCQNLARYLWRYKLPSTPIEVGKDRVSFRATQRTPRGFAKRNVFSRRSWLRVGRTSTLRGTVVRNPPTHRQRVQSSDAVHGSRSDTHAVLTNGHDECVQWNEHSSATNHQRRVKLLEEIIKVIFDYYSSSGKRQVRKFLFSTKTKNQSKCSKKLNNRIIIIFYACLAYKLQIVVFFSQKLLPDK